MKKLLMTLIAFGFAGHVLASEAPAEADGKTVQEYKAKQADQQKKAAQKKAKKKASAEQKKAEDTAKQ
ncbi:hypothetical protein GCM10007860_08520 [Chitiniphilus shinanonensis]|uniref:Uncharacterized protein n=1 Tax=Chitiniphilus shinanonensis TaxID=553088 RepID=A0ABQ6BQU7_9NEIS|nr:hypothetical protein [Chitiniphilus shinanonensis]GLS03707.1 hypothetical protein GCM10007860_08520 [Chitiniphilus shinanonensis]